MRARAEAPEELPEPGRVRNLMHCSKHQRRHSTHLRQSCTAKEFRNASCSICVLSHLMKMRTRRTAAWQAGAVVKPAPTVSPAVDRLSPYRRPRQHLFTPFHACVFACFLASLYSFGCAGRPTALLGWWAAGRPLRSRASPASCLPVLCLELGDAMSCAGPLHALWNLKVSLTPWRSTHHGMQVVCRSADPRATERPPHVYSGSPDPDGR